jgi:hypothetical protein
VSGSYDCADRRPARWVALTCIRASSIVVKVGGLAAASKEGTNELHRFPTSGRLPAFGAGFF